ncbi:MAG: CHAT domain-containing protein [Chloroflexi bacterium]|nr:CHAT domain-containing protein [Chloroflexota bacterium]
MGKKNLIIKAFSFIGENYIVILIVFAPPTIALFVASLLGKALFDIKTLLLYIAVWVIILILILLGVRFLLYKAKEAGHTFGGGMAPDLDDVLEDIQEETGPSLMMSMNLSGNQGPDAIPANGGGGHTPSLIFPKKKINRYETYTKIEGDDYAYVDDVYELEVSLSDVLQEIAGEHVYSPSVGILTEETAPFPIQITLYTKDFDLASDDDTWDREIIFIPEQNKSENAAVYRLLAQGGRRERDFADLEISFFYNDIEVGFASKTVEVLKDRDVVETPVDDFPKAVYPVGYEDEIYEPHLPSLNLSIGLEEKPVDLQVEIKPSKDLKTLEWKISSHLLKEGDSSRPPIYRDTSAYLEAKQYSVHKVIDIAEKRKNNQGCLNNKSTSNEFLGVLETMTNAVPDIFWDIYTKALKRHKELDQNNVEHNFSILLVTADTEIPWELMPIKNIYDEESLLEAESSWQEKPLLGIQHSVGRWIIGAGNDNQPKSCLNLVGFTLSVPEYLKKPLPVAQAEKEKLKAKYKAQLLEGDPKVFRDFMEGGGAYQGTGIFHFSGHGECCKQKRIVWLKLSDTDASVDKAQRLYTYSEARSSNKVAMWARKTHSSDSLAFFNACRAGRSESEALGPKGYWARALFPRGFDSFIGPLWNVNDSHAGKVANKFYELALEEGVPLGEIMRQIRGEFLADGEYLKISFLAYIYYGHPMATIQYTEFKE